jgi:hypothetical protein
MHVSEASPELHQEGDDRLVYRGTRATDLDLWVRFRPELPVRLWRNITRFLTTPI